MKRQLTHKKPLITLGAATLRALKKQSLVITDGVKPGCKVYLEGGLTASGATVYEALQDLELKLLEREDNQQRKDK